MLIYENRARQRVYRSYPTEYFILCGASPGSRSAAVHHGAAAALAAGGTPGMETRTLAAPMRDDGDPSADGSPGPGD